MGQLGDEEPTTNMRIAIGLILQLPVVGGQPSRRPGLGHLTGPSAAFAEVTILYSDLTLHVFQNHRHSKARMLEPAGHITSPV
jgi:hypothetical protein